MTTRDRLLALLVVTVWGLNFVVVEWGLSAVPGGVPPTLFVVLRFCLVSLAAFVVPRPAARWRDLALVAAFLSIGQFGFMYSALAAGLPPGLTSLVLQVQAAFTVLLGIIVLHEHPRRMQLVGVVLGLVGLGLVALGRGGSVPLLALGLCVTAAACWAAGNIASRRLQGVGGLALTVWSGLLVPVPLLLLAVLLEGPARIGDALVALAGPGAWAAWLSTLYTAVLGSLFGYGVWNSLLGRHRVAEVAPYSLLVPVVGMTAALLLRGERPTVLALLGGVVLVTGVAVTVLPARSSPVLGEPVACPATDGHDRI